MVPTMSGGTLTLAPTLTLTLTLALALALTLTLIIYDIFVTIRIFERPLIGSRHAACQQPAENWAAHEDATVAPGPRG